MEKKKTVFDYLAQVLIVFGFTMLVMNIFCLAFGTLQRVFPQCLHWQTGEFQ